MVEGLYVMQVVILVVFDLVIDVIIGECVQCGCGYCVWFGDLVQFDEYVYCEQQWQGWYDGIENDYCIVEGDEEDNGICQYGVSGNLCECGVDL